MKIKLLNYLNEKFVCNIPNDTEKIKIHVISGDMVLISPIYFDTGEGSRVLDFFDGEIELTKDKFSILNKLKDAYDLFKIK